MREDNPDWSPPARSFSGCALPDIALHRRSTAGVPAAGQKPPFSCTISCSEVPPAFSRQHLFEQLSHIFHAARELRRRNKAWLSQHV